MSSSHSPITPRPRLASRGPNPADAAESPSGGAVVLSLDSPRALVESIPHLVGFVPHHSLVLIFFAQVEGTTRRRSGPVLRIDLSDDPEAVAQVLSHAVVAVGEQFPAESAAIVLWPESEPWSEVGEAHAATLVTTARQEWLPVADAARRVVRRHGLRVHDALLVAGLRFVSLECLNPRCCPPEGDEWSTVDDSTVSARVVAAGIPMPRQDRAQLVADVAADPVAVDAVDAALSRGSSWPTAESATALVWAWLLQTERTDPDEAGTAAALCAALLWGTARDAAVRHLVDADTDLEAALSAWQGLCRSAPGSFAAAPAALAALAAGLIGAGAAANAALERGEAALVDHPGEFIDPHPAAQLLENARVLLASGAGPERLQALLASVYADPVSRAAEG